MISIQQWRASIGRFQCSQSSQSNENTFEISTDDKSTDPISILKLSRKYVFACVFLLLSLFVISSSKCGMESCYSKAVIRSLLIRSGIEQNPGPTPAEVLANLIASGSSDIVKKTLNRFETEKDFNSNIKNFQKTNITIDDLKKTLMFLKEVNEETLFNDYLKDGLIELLVKRVYQLLPETCNTCGKSYHISIYEKPLVTCMICSKGCCQSCSDKYAERLNNVGLNNVFWFCSTCNQEILEE